MGSSEEEVKRVESAESQPQMQDQEEDQPVIQPMPQASEEERKVGIDTMHSEGLGREEEDADQGPPVEIAVINQQEVEN